MNSTFNFGTDIVSREILVYIEPTSVSRSQSEHSYAGIIYFSSHTSFTSAVVPPFTSIEKCSVYRIDVNFTTYKPYDLC